MEIRTFEDEINPLYEMMRASWVADYRRAYRQPVQDFTPEFLRWNLYKPGSDPSLMIGAYEAGELVGFAAAIPYTVFWQGGRLKASLSTFFTCHRDHRRKGIGTALARERLKRVMAASHDLNYFVQDEGHAVERLYPRLSRELGLSLRHLCRFTFLSRVLDPVAVARLTDLSPVERLALPLLALSFGAGPADHGVGEIPSVSTLMPLFNTPLGPVGIQVHWHPWELAHHLRSALSHVTYHQAGQQVGIINHYRIPLIGVRRDSAPIAVIDWAWFADMPLLSRYRLVRRLCAAEREAGVCLLLIPTFPAFDPLPFFMNRFVPTGRYHNIRGYDFNRQLPEGVRVHHLMFR